MLLAIDTSTTLTGVALYESGDVLAECVWNSGRDHTAQLVPQLELLLRHLGRTRGDLAAVVVAVGPGSWSGLRVGVSVAKGLALARGLPVVGIGTLDALAYQHYRPGMPVLPLIRLGRERFASADFSAQERARRLGDYRNVTLAEICATVHGRTLFCGDIDVQVRETLRRGLGEAAHFPLPADAPRRPAYLAELGWSRLQQGDADDLSTLEPIYLGHPVKSTTTQ